MVVVQKKKKKGLYSRGTVQEERTNEKDRYKIKKKGGGRAACTLFFLGRLNKFSKVRKEFFLF